MKEGGNLLIYPEGCSHDQPDIIPFKNGIAVMAIKTATLYNVPVQFAPCGLNYWRSHKLRSRLVVEYGKPFGIDEKVANDYKEGKKEEAVE